MFMETVSLLFDADCQVLGEFFTRDGSFVRAMLTEEGEQVVGNIVASWQTEGVPFHRQFDGVEYQDRVSIRDPFFFDAVRQWASTMRFSFVDVSATAFVCWQLLVQLPLERIQSYSMLLALRSLSNDDLDAWKAALEEAAAAVQAERNHATVRMTDMWRSLAQQLVTRASRSSNRAGNV